MIFIDFEFTESNQRNPRVFCCALQEDEKTVESYWCLSENSNERDNADTRHHLIRRLSSLKGSTIVGYAVIAEIRCFLALGLRPEDYEWVDLHAEFRQLVNENDRWKYGSQWTKQRKSNWIKRYCRPNQNKEIIYTESGDEYTFDHSRPQCNLINAKLKFLEIDSDPRKKDDMRDLILQNKPSYTVEEQQRILHYCMGDVKYLPHLYTIMTEELQELLPNRQTTDIVEYQLARGQWCVDVARMEQTGIPIDVQAVQNLSDNYEAAVEHAILECNKSYPFWIERHNKTDKFIGPERFVKKRDSFKAYLESKNLLQDWPLTESGLPSEADKVLSAYNSYPELKALQHTKHLIQQLRWYRPEAKKEFDKEIGSDNRLRPYYNPYGTVSSRNSPPSSGFIPAQSRWLRALIRAPQGHAIVGTDYSSQEFFVAACLSDDQNMIDTYKTGNPYKELALRIGLATDQTYDEATKKLCKAFVLGVGFGMGEKKAASYLNLDIEAASLLITQHRDTYPDYWEFRKQIRDKVYRKEPLLLASGWALFSDTYVLTAQNFPVQGMSQDILRLAVHNCHAANLQVIFSHHDAVYVLCKDSEAEKTKDILEAIMVRASDDTSFMEKGMRVESHIYYHNEVWQEAGYEEYGKFLEKAL